MQMEDAPEPGAARDYDSVGAVAKLASSERYTSVMQVSSNGSRPPDPESICVTACLSCIIIIVVPQGLGGNQESWSSRLDLNSRSWNAEAFSSCRLLIRC